MYFSKFVTDMVNNVFVFYKKGMTASMTTEQKDFLKENNFDVKGTLDRFMNKEDLYERFIYKFVDDKNYGELVATLEQKDYEKAYIAAHTLKGVSGNLGINDVFKSCEDILAKFKAKEYDVDEYLIKIKTDYDKAIETINTLKSME